MMLKECRGIARKLKKQSSRKWHKFGQRFMSTREIDYHWNLKSSLIVSQKKQKMVKAILAYESGNLRTINYWFLKKIKWKCKTCLLTWKIANCTVYELLNITGCPYHYEYELYRKYIWSNWFNLVWRNFSMTAWHLNFGYF